MVPNAAATTRDLERSAMSERPALSRRRFNAAGSILPDSTALVMASSTSSGDSEFVDMVLGCYVSTE